MKALREVRKSRSTARWRRKRKRSEKDKADSGRIKVIEGSNGRDLGVIVRRQLAEIRCEVGELSEQARAEPLGRPKCQRRRLRTERRRLSKNFRRM
jgi:hypothetical protein